MTAVRCTPWRARGRSALKAGSLITTAKNNAIVKRNMARSEGWFRHQTSIAQLVERGRRSRNMAKPLINESPRCFVIARSEATKQSSSYRGLDCFAALAMTGRLGVQRLIQVRDQIF